MPNEALNRLIAELSRSSADITEEESILREATVATKATFATFMQQHVMAVYDDRENPRVHAILTNAIGAIKAPDPNTKLVTLIEQSHLPDGDVKVVVTAIATSGTVNPATISSAETSALRTATDQFQQARTAFEGIVSGQPPFDAALSAVAPPAILDRLAAAKKLISSTPDQLEQFDTLRTMANLLPLPAGVSNTIQTVAQIGSTIQSTVSTVSQVASSLSALGGIANIGMSFLTTGGIGALAGSLGSILGSGGPSNQEILDAVNKVGEQVQQMHAEMVSRFDQVDRELQSVNAKLDTGFATSGAQLADIHIDLRTVVATTTSIELAILQDRDTLQRAVIDEIGEWSDQDLKVLHDNLVTLLSAIDRANAHADDLTRVDFRRMAQYFTTLARTDAAKGALTGLQAAENYDLAFAAVRLSRQSALYPVNYTMSFPIAGLGTPSLQTMIAAPEAQRDLTTRPYVNERVWAIAANAITSMIERWPAYANEIPGLRDAYDAVVNNGKDLNALAKAVQTPDPVTKGLGQAYSSAFQVYQSHLNNLHSALRDALRDEAINYARAQGLNPTQTDALGNAFSANQLWGSNQWDAVTNGLGFARSSIKYDPPALFVTLCDGQGPAHQLAGNALTGFGLQSIREALVLNTGVLSACVDIPYYVTKHDVNVPNHGGYGIQGQGAPCAADSRITMMSFQVRVRFMFRLASDPDDAAHRIIVAEATATGPEVETQGTITGQPHWSGQQTEQGHDWNSECHNPNAWQIGMTNGFYIGDPAYVDRYWSTISAGFSQNYGSVQNGPLPYASADRQTVITSMRTQDDPRLLSLYANLFTDLLALLHQPSPLPQTRIADIAIIPGEVHALEGVRALLRELTTIAYERTLSRDDVLSGLLFGTESLPGGAEFLQAATVCEHGHSDQPIDSCLSRFIRVPANRSQRLAQRLLLVNHDIDAGRSIDMPLRRTYSTGP